MIARSMINGVAQMNTGKPRFFYFREPRALAGAALPAWPLLGAVHLGNTGLSLQGL